MPYKIEMLYLTGWSDAGWTENIEYEERPMRFATIADAQVGLAEFFAQVKEAVGINNTDSEENPDDYQIVTAS